VPIDKRAVDAICIYCPDTDQCYYIRPAEFRSSATLRITPSKNGQHVGILEAEAFRRFAP